MTIKDWQEVSATAALLFSFVGGGAWIARRLVGRDGILPSAFAAQREELALARRVNDIEARLASMTTRTDRAEEDVRETRLALAAVHDRLEVLWTLVERLKRGVRRLVLRLNGESASDVEEDLRS